MGDGDAHDVVVVRDVDDLVGEPTNADSADPEGGIKDVDGRAGSRVPGQRPNGRPELEHKLTAETGSLPSRTCRACCRAWSTVWTPLGTLAPWISPSVGAPERGDGHGCDSVAQREGPGTGVKDRSR